MSESETNRPKVGVAAIIVRGKKVLLGKRKGPHGNSTWGFVGGHLEFMESFEDCAKREAEEEAGIKIRILKKAVAFTNDFFKKEGKHYITVYLLAEIESGEPKVMEKDVCEEWKWFEWDNLPRPLFLPIENLIAGGYSPFKD